MGKYNDNGTITFVASAAIAQYARVALAADGKISQAGLAVADIGVAMDAAFAAGDVVAVKLRNAPGTCPMIAFEALAVAALVYTEANGKVQDTAEATSFLVGRALDAATADGDIIEVLRFDGGAANP